MFAQNLIMREKMRTLNGGGLGGAVLENTHDYLQGTGKKAQKSAFPEQNGVIDTHSW